MICAGEPLPRATRETLEERWGAEVYDHIGGTEPCAWAVINIHLPGILPGGSHFQG